VRDAQHLLLATEPQARALAGSPRLLPAAPEQLLEALQLCARRDGVTLVRALDAAASKPAKLLELEAQVLGSWPV
jgi:hypothetical protein